MKKRTGKEELEKQRAKMIEGVARRIWHLNKKWRSTDENVFLDSYKCVHCGKKTNIYYGFAD